MDEAIEHPPRREVNGTSADHAAHLPDDRELERLLGQFRPYLRSIAEAALPRELQAKLDASDLVQETLLRGFRRFSHYRGTTERELTAWLTEILQNFLVDVRRGFQCGARDVRREQPLVELACSKSPTASDLARKTESQEQLQQAMAKLPEDYRTVLDLRQQYGLTFPEIGVRMDRSADAARMLWGRAILQLGRLLHSDDG